MARRCSSTTSTEQLPSSEVRVRTRRSTASLRNLRSVPPFGSGTEAAAPSGIASPNQPFLKTYTGSPPLSSRLAMMSPSMERPTVFAT